MNYFKYKHKKKKKKKKKMQANSVPAAPLPTVPLNRADDEYV